jgi:hypothetical protein
MKCLVTCLIGPAALAGCGNPPPEAFEFRWKRVKRRERLTQIIFSAAQASSATP